MLVKGAQAITWTTDDPFLTRVNVSRGSNELNEEKRVAYTFTEIARILICGQPDDICIGFKFPAQTVCLSNILFNRRHNFIIDRPSLD